MRMWMIDPSFLCRQHLLGEHSEIHKWMPILAKGYKQDGRFKPIAYIQLIGIKERHDELAEEMLDRGYNHKSPLVNVPDFKSLYPKWYYTRVDIEVSYHTLIKRCSGCRRRMV